MVNEILSFELNTCAKIPSVGLGTWQSEPGVVGQAVEAAIKNGYRHIDCARKYNNEKEIDVALKKLFDDGVVQRKDLFITSKLCCLLVIFPSTMLQIHWPVRMKKGSVGFEPENLLPSDIPSTWKAMEALYDSGKARALGVSNFSAKKLSNLLDVARVPPAVNQVECHPSWQQAELHKYTKSKGVHLSHPVIVATAEKLGKTPAQVALRWGVQTGHSVLPKSTNESRIKANLDIFGWSIPDDLFVKFSEIEQASLFSFSLYIRPFSRGFV
ncbi:hypothetical protein ACS0TY_021506 [Phlomoides rotata]